MLPSPRLIALTLFLGPVFLAGSLYPPFIGIGIIGLMLLLVLLLLDWVTLPRPDSISITLDFADKISIGVASEGRIGVTNQTRKKFEVTIAQDYLEHMQIMPDTSRIVIPAKRNDGFSFSVTCLQRGRFSIPGLYIRLRRPWGLLYRQFYYPLDTHFKVYPNLTNLKRYEILIRRAASAEQGLAQLKRMGEGSDFESLRYYVPGDEISKMEWKITAKRNQLIIKNFQPQRQQSVVVAIDTGRATAGQFEGLSRLDYMVNAALMLAYTTLRQKDWFSLVAFSDRIESYLPPVCGIKNVERVAQSLYELQSRMVESDYGMLCRFLGMKNRKRSLLCIMTDIVEKEANSILIAYLSRFARHHLPLAVTLADPQITSLAHEPLSKTKDYYLKAAALDTLTARRQALLTMRQCGISVLDVLPHHLTPELLNRYMTIKARQRL